MLQMVQAFTGAPAILEVEKGGRISLMNGHVTGGFIELVSQIDVKCSVMRKPHFAFVKTKVQISCMVTAQLIRAFVFAT